MIDISTIGVAFDTRGLKAGQAELARTRQAADKTADAADRVGRQATKAGGGFQAMTSSMRAFRGAVGAMGVVALGTSFIRLADSVTVLNNQLKLATGSAANASRAYGELYRIAQSARVSFTDLGSTYAQIARSTQELGISESRLMTVTEAIGNAMTVSGGSAQGMNAALIQLSQGFASGTLRGEELNSVMEQTPRLAQAIAKGMGITLGELRAMGQAGALTSEAVIKALESQADVLRNEVQSATLTVGQSTTMLGNALTNLIGELDKTTGASGIVANTFKALALELDNTNAVMKQTAADGGGSLMQVFTGLGTLVERLKFGYLNEQVNAFNGAINQLTGGILGLNTQVDLTPDHLRPMNEQIKLTADRVKQAEAEYAKLAVQLSSAPDNIYIKSEMGNLARYIAKLKEAQAEQSRLSGVASTSTMGTGSVGSGDTALLRAQRGEWDAMAGTRAKYMESARTDIQKLNDELDKARRAFGGVIPAEVEASLRAKFIKPMREAKVDTEAARLELQLFNDEIAQFDAATELGGEENKLRREMVQEAIKDARELHEEQMKAYTESAKTAQERLDAFEQETNAIYLSEAAQISLAEAVELTTIARLEESKVAAAGTEGAVAEIEKEIEARKKLASAINSRDVRDAGIKASKEAASAWQKTADQIENTLTDALMRGFESGESFGDNLAKSITNTFKTYVAKEISKAITKAIMSALANSQWASALSSIMGGASGGGGTDWVSLAAKGYQYYSTAGTAAGAAGATSTTGAATAAGAGGGGSASAAGIGAIGWAAIIVAAIYAGSKLYDAGYDRTNLQGIGEDNRYNYGVENSLYKINEQTGLLNEKWANIMSGTTRMAHMFGYKLHQAGIRGNFDGAGGIQTDQYQSYKGGWLRGSDKVFSGPMEAGRAAALTESLKDIQDSTEVLVRSMGGNADAVRSFAGGVTIDLRGLTQSEAAKKMAEEFEDLQYRMAEAAGISRDMFQSIIDSVNANMERAGISGEAIADAIVGGATGRLTEAEVGEQLSEIIIGGIYRSIAQGPADMIAQAFTSQIIQPLLTAAMMGAPLAGVVSQAAIQSVVATAQNAVAIIQAVYADPAFQQAIKDIEGTIRSVSSISVRPARHVRSFGAATLKVGDDAKRAAEELKRAWKSIADSITEEIRRIRGEILGDTSLGQSAAQSQFAIATAQARSGNQDAAKMLPELSRAVLSIAEQTASSLGDLRSVQGSTLASLAETRRILSQRYGLAIPAFADGGTHSGGWAMVGERGPELAYMPPAQIYNANDTRQMMGGSDELVREVRALRAEVRSLRSSSEKTADKTGLMQADLHDAIKGRVSIKTSEVAA